MDKTKDMTGEGEFETGCHTAAGNDLALYIQTTSAPDQAPPQGAQGPQVA